MVPSCLRTSSFSQEQCLLPLQCVCVCVCVCVFVCVDDVTQIQYTRKYKQIHTQIHTNTHTPFLVLRLFRTAWPSDFFLFLKGAEPPPSAVCVCVCVCVCVDDDTFKCTQLQYTHKCKQIHTQIHTNTHKYTQIHTHLCGFDDLYFDEMNRV